MIRRITATTFVVSCIGILVTCVLIITLLFDTTGTKLYDDLSIKSRYISQALNKEDDILDFLNDFDDPGTRITWINAHGTVLFDNKADISSLENHLSRPEVDQAIKNEQGVSSRFSKTISENTLYYAVRLDNSTVIRLSVAQKNALGLFLQIFWPIVIILIFALILSYILARKLSRRIVKPINELNLDNPLENDVYNELTPLLRRIYQQKEFSEAQIHTITKRESEIKAITQNMNEGLVMLNSDNHILSINESACRIFDVTEDMCVGKSVMTLSRNQCLLGILSFGDNQSRETVIEIDGRLYQFLSSPIFAQAAFTGSVLLILDVTQREATERMRREFTSNVSHELKTPLTSISGYAELIRDGIARVEDTPQFAARIFNEAKRLLLIIDDLLKLSKIEELDADLKKEKVDLFAIIKGVEERLSPLAKQKDILFSVSGEKAYVLGLSRILDEVVYNVCENAIKYTKNSGRVSVTLTQNTKNVILTVKDNGIGIPKSKKDKVFERFYRVDESHSKNVEGTGLGLAIVKHGVALHQGNIVLTSAEGTGTRVEITFPANAQ